MLDGVARRARQSPWRRLMRNYAAGISEGVNMKINLDDFRVRAGEKVKLKKWPTRIKPCYKSKEHYQEMLGEHRKELSALQSLLYAYNRYSVLLIFQAMDTAGKDGAIKHGMSGVNPQGCQVFSFKQLRPLSDRTPSTRPCWKQLMSTAITESRKPGSNKM